MFNKLIAFSKKYNQILTLLFSVSFFVSFAASMSTTVVGALEKSSMNYLEMILVQYATFYIITLIMTTYFIYIIHPLLPSKQYLMFLKEEGKDLYIYYALDENTLVLGDSKSQEATKAFYLYDYKTKTYTKFVEEGQLAKSKM